MAIVLILDSAPNNFLLYYKVKPCRTFTLLKVFWNIMEEMSHLAYTVLYCICVVLLCIFNLIYGF